MKKGFVKGKQGHSEVAGSMDFEVFPGIARLFVLSGKCTELATHVSDDKNKSPTHCGRFLPQGQKACFKG